jgi:hypothetical protein
VWLPGPRLLVLYVAVAGEPLSVLVATGLLSVVNVTVPVGVIVPLLQVTVAVKVTFCPIVDGIWEEVSVVDVVAVFTVCVTAGEVLPPQLLAPLVNTAEMLWTPRARVLVVKAAWPDPLSAVGPPIVALLSLKMTVPVGVKPVQEGVAVKVTGWPTVEGVCDEITVVVVETKKQVPVQVKLIVTDGAAPPELMIVAVEGKSEPPPPPPLPKVKSAAPPPPPPP